MEGSVSIVMHALEELKKRGVKLTDKEKAELIKSLMIVSISDSGDAKPVGENFAFSSSFLPSERLS